MPIGTLIAAVVPGELEYISKFKAVSYSQLGSSSQLSSWSLLIIIVCIAEPKKSQ
jgi:hypothetical protein